MTATSSSASASTQVAASYFEAWRRNDIEAVRPLLHDEVDFAGALGTTQGIEQTLKGLGGMFAMTSDVRLVKRWADGPDVITWFELSTEKTGPIPVVNWSHVAQGRIDRIRVTFDPRPLLA